MFHSHTASAFKNELRPTLSVDSNVIVKNLTSFCIDQSFPCAITNPSDATIEPSLNVTTHQQTIAVLMKEEWSEVLKQIRTKKQ